jgi:DNA polymerase-3 subunit beta
MLRLFERPQFAVSRETTRYYLNGIFLHDAEAGKIDAVATDGHRLAVVGVASEPLFPQSSNDRGLIVPLRTAELIVKLLRARKPENVTLARSQTLIGIAADGISLISKLIDATYPDYERLLPGPQPNAATIDRDELIAALERLAAVVDHARERRDKVLLGVVGLVWAEGDNAIKLSLSRQHDAGTDLVDAALTGSAQIAFNVELLIEQLKELEGERVRFDIGGNGGPTMITDPGDEGLVTLLMPILR